MPWMQNSINYTERIREEVGLDYRPIRQGHLNDHPVNLILGEYLTLIQEYSYPAMTEIGFNGIITACESFYDALDICSCRDIASKNIELGILLGNISLETMCLRTELQCTNQLSHGSMV